MIHRPVVGFDLGASGRHRLRAVMKLEASVGVHESHKETSAHGQLTFAPGVNGGLAAQLAVGF
ncbi:MAG: 3-dehydroquinate dehydratase [Kiritimatiellia bacterium]